jgi:hypothetical protein
MSHVEPDHQERPIEGRPYKPTAKERRIGQDRATIAEIDRELDQLPPSKRMNTNVIYRALWLLRDTLVAKLPKEWRP